jgi:hypothetical protein
MAVPVILWSGRGHGERAVEEGGDPLFPLTRVRVQGPGVPRCRARAVPAAATNGADRMVVTAPVTSGTIPATKVTRPATLTGDQPTLLR